MEHVTRKGISRNSVLCRHHPKPEMTALKQKVTRASEGPRKTQEREDAGQKGPQAKRSLGIVPCFETASQTPSAMLLSLRFESLRTKFKMALAFVKVQVKGNGCGASRWLRW